jgi:hypothetical protein
VETLKKAVPKKDTSTPVAAKPKSQKAGEAAAVSVEVHESNLTLGCWSPALSGHVLQLPDANSTEDKQFSPILSATKVTPASQLPRGSGSSSGEIVSCPALKTLDSNLPKATTSRIPSRTTDKGLHHSNEPGGDLCQTPKTNSVTFNVQGAGDDCTPMVFQCAKPPVQGKAQGSERGAAIKFLTPLGASLSEPDTTPSSVDHMQSQKAAQAVIHPLFQSRVDTQAVVPVFRLPSGHSPVKALPQKASQPPSEAYASPHVTLVMGQQEECLSDPMPARDPRKLLTGEPSDAVLGTPPYAKFMRHLNGDVSSVFGVGPEPSLAVPITCDSEDPAVSPAPLPSQPSSENPSAATTPDGHNFQDLLANIVAHNYRSPAVFAGMAKFNGASEAGPDNYGLQPADAAACVSPVLAGEHTQHVHAASEARSCGAADSVCPVHGSSEPQCAGVAASPMQESMDPVACVHEQLSVSAASEAQASSQPQPMPALPIGTCSPIELSADDAQSSCGSGGCSATGADHGNGPGFTFSSLRSETLVCSLSHLSSGLLGEVPGTCVKLELSIQADNCNAVAVRFDVVSKVCHESVASSGPRLRRVLSSRLKQRLEMHGSANSAVPDSAASTGSGALLAARPTNSAFFLNQPAPFGDDAAASPCQGCSVAPPTSPQFQAPALLAHSFGGHSGAAATAPSPVSAMCGSIHQVHAPAELSAQDASIVCTYEMADDDDVINMMSPIKSSSPDRTGAYVDVCPVIHVISHKALSSTYRWVIN